MKDGDARSTTTGAIHDELLTPEQAAPLIDLTLGKALPPAIRIGRRHYYLRSDLERQIAPRGTRPNLVAI